MSCSCSQHSMLQSSSSSSSPSSLCWCTHVSLISNRPILMCTSLITSQAPSLLHILTLSFHLPHALPSLCLKHSKFLVVVSPIFPQLHRTYQPSFMIDIEIEWRFIFNSKLKYKPNHHHLIFVFLDQLKECTLSHCEYMAMAKQTESFIMKRHNKT